MDDETKAYLGQLDFNRDKLPDMLYQRCREICLDIERIIGEIEGVPSGSAGVGHRSLLVAIDGCSGSGKTTVASALQEVLNCNLFHMDDFFLRPGQRTSERFLEPGGNVDYERFYESIILPVLAGKAFTYRPFDCKRQCLGPETEVKPKLINIVEGVYSQHPYFGACYDLTYWMFVSKTEQRNHILERNGVEMLKRFEEEWIPLEEIYFRSLGIGRD